MTYSNREAELELAEAVVAALVATSTTLATAESLTGGWIGMALTSVPGSSAVYRGGFITYATDLKCSLGGVDPETLATLGPVAAETARQMATGAARSCRAEWGLAVTGVAGPEPQDGHPVGQVFVGLAGPTVAARAEELKLSGSREQIRRQTVQLALRRLQDLLRP